MATGYVDVAVRVKGQSGVEKLTRQMDALEKEVQSLRQKVPQATNSIRSFGRASKTAASGAQALTAAFAKVAAVIGTVTAAVGSFNTAVARTESERRIQILASAYGEAAQLAEVAANASDKFGTSQTETNNALADTYARLRPVGVGLADIEKIYGGFNTAARLAGATATESSNAFTQLSQALGSGALRGDEFNSISEQAPLLLQAISKETGVAVGALRDYAAEGKITADVVIKALKRIDEEGADQLAETMKGPQQAIRNFQNSFEDLSAGLGKLAEPALIDFFNGLTAVIDVVVSKMQQIGQVFAAAANCISAPFIAVAEGIQKTGPQITNFGGTVMEIVGGIVKLLNDTVNNVLIPVSTLSVKYEASNYLVCSVCAGCSQRHVGSS